MDRYNYTSIEEHAQRILPNQMWVKKSHPQHSILIQSYHGNGNYQCQPIESINIGISILMSSSQISNHYNFLRTLDNL